MKVLMTGFLVLVSSFSLFAMNGEVMNCLSAEPPINYKFNPSTNNLSSAYHADKVIFETISKHAHFRSVDNEEHDGEVGSKYEIFDKESGKILIKMTLDGNGSDGISNFKYPFSAEIDNRSIVCFSTSVLPVDRSEAVYNLKN